MSDDIIDRLVQRTQQAKDNVLAWIGADDFVLPVDEAEKEQLKDDVMILVIYLEESTKRAMKEKPC